MSVTLSVEKLEYIVCCSCNDSSHFAEALHPMYTMSYVNVVVKHALALLLLLIPISSFAGQIKIFDERGLSRAVKVIHSERATVTVELHARLNEGVALTLTRSDGLTSDIADTPVSDLQHTFMSVGEGTWILHGIKGEKIKSVRISE